ncbi:MAG: NAD(P)-dependent oxidoreductase [Asgard group archaeon]|nr:NAD(P)-dependent oxidoreductase [Asgard group archaeon]
MKLLLTGAFGNVGASTLKALLRKGKHDITCYDQKTWTTWKKSRQFRKDVKIIWGDIRNAKKVSKAVANQDIVLHIAAVIPPKANKNNKYTMEVNYGGTKNVVDAILNSSSNPKLLYTSSVAIYGDIREKDSPFVNESCPPNPSPGDIYARTKIKAEEYIRKSNLIWSIFRLSYIPNIETMKLTPLMFQMPLDTPLEFTHTRDCGIALANAIEQKEIWNNVWNLGGGEKCQLSYKEFLERMLPAMGLEMLPKEAFSTSLFHCCYYTKTELTDSLNYQNKTIEDLISEMVSNNSIKRFLAKIFKPLVLKFMLSKSPYYKKKKKS